MMKTKTTKKTWVRVLCVSSLVALGSLWACSNAPPYGGGGRDLGPQAANMNADTGTEGSADSGVDTGVDTGVPDMGGP